MGNWKTFDKSQGICSAIVLLMDGFTPFLHSQGALRADSTQWRSPDMSVTGLNVNSKRWTSRPCMLRYAYHRTWEKGFSRVKRRGEGCQAAVETVGQLAGVLVEHGAWSWAAKSERRWENIEPLKAWMEGIAQRTPKKMGKDTSIPKIPREGCLALEELGHFLPL